MTDILEAYLKGAKALGIDRNNPWGFPLGDLWPNNFVGNFFINTGMRQPEMLAYRIIKAIIGPAG